MTRDIVSDWEHNGYECRIRLIDVFGLTSHFCGYVRIPENHKWYGIEPVPDLDVHGGVTWVGCFSFDPGRWWIGFDCAHSGDECNPRWKDIDEVVKETNRLADQIAEAAE